MLKWKMSLFLLLMCLVNTSEATFYTTASGMQYLLQVEEVLAKPFLKYYHSRLNKLRQLEDFLDELEEGIVETEDETYLEEESLQGKYDEQFVGNPINSWVLINRMVKKWYRFSERFRHDKQETKAQLNVTTMAIRITGFENKFELKGSIYAIMKVQETYQVTVDQYIKGIHKLQQRITPMEIFDIGRIAVQLNYYKLAVEWLEHALQLFSYEFLKYERNLADLFENLGWSYYQIGDIESAIDYTEKLLELIPHSKIGNHNIRYYKRALFDSEFDPSLRKKAGLHLKPWMIRNDAMCRKEEKIKPHLAKELYCQFYTPQPQFYLKPLKLEVAFKDPRIVIFHDFLMDSELTLVKESARHRLNIARVYDSTSGKETTANYRISKNAWLNEAEFNFIPKIRRRAAAATGLNINYAEELQVANYGIGGSYEPHWDHATPPHKPSIFGYYGGMGNRIATFLIYLTDIEKGGGTVFTETEKGVMTDATRGSAVFWYNLHRNGTGDVRTRHGGCPVMLGEKWIVNLWIHEHGQEFIRPCSLNRFE